MNFKCVQGKVAQSHLFSNSPKNHHEWTKSVDKGQPGRDFRSRGRAGGFEACKVPRSFCITSIRNAGFLCQLVRRSAREFCIPNAKTLARVAGMLSTLSKHNGSH